MEPLTLVPAPETRATLYVLEEGLLALLDTEELVSEEQQAAFLEDLGRQLAVARDKREGVGRFLLHLESQIELAAAERKRLTERQARFESARDRLKAHVVGVIERLGPDERGKLRKLEGHTLTLSAPGLASAVEITDETALPMSCRTIEVRMPADLWEQVLDSIEFDLRDEVRLKMGKPAFEPSKTRIKQAIEMAAGAEVGVAKASGALSVQHESVPGARLNLNRHRLEVK